MVDCARVWGFQSGVFAIRGVRRWEIDPCSMLEHPAGNGVRELRVITYKMEITTWNDRRVQRAHSKSPGAAFRRNRASETPEAKGGQFQSLQE